MRFLSHPKRTAILFGVFIFFFIYSIIVFIAFTHRTDRKAVDKLTKEPTYVAEIPVSKEVTVEKKALAKKLDLNRKMITPKSLIYPDPSLPSAFPERI